MLKRQALIIPSAFDARSSCYKIHDHFHYLCPKKCIKHSEFFDRESWHWHEMRGQTSQFFGVERQRRGGQPRARIGEERREVGGEGARAALELHDTRRLAVLPHRHEQSEYLT